MDFTFDTQSGKVTDITITVSHTTQMMAAVGNTPDPAVAAIVQQAKQESDSNRGVESRLSNALAQAAKDAITNSFELGALGGVIEDWGCY